MGTLPYPNPTNTGQWADDLLTELGDPTTATNVGYIEATEQVESPSGYGYNPEGTEEKANNSKNANSAGVQAYNSWAEGLAATVATYQDNTKNSSLLSLLKKGNASVAQLSSAEGVQGASWATGDEPGITSLGTSTPFTYGGAYGEQKNAAGVATSSTGVLGDIFNTLNPFNVQGDAGGQVVNDTKNAFSGWVGEIIKWVEEGAADVTFIGFGLVLVLVGLVVALRPGTNVSVDPSPVASSARDVAET